MSGILIDLLLLGMFISVIPYPRLRLYDEWLVLTITYLISISFIIARILKPIFDLLRINLESNLVSWTVGISTIAPKVGDYILSRGFGIERIGHTFDKNVGREMIEFRRDLRMMYVKKRGIAEEPPQKGELMADIKRTHSKIRQRHTIGEILIGMSIGLLALIIGSISFLAGIGILLSLYLLIFPLSMALRRVIVDTLAYPVEMVDVEAEEIRHPPRTATLGFMQGWNQMLLQNEAIIHKLIFVSFVKGEFVLGYERGAELIEEVLMGEMELEEAFDKLIHEELGEDTTESRWIRRLLKRFVGI